MCDWAYAYRIDRGHPPARFPRLSAERAEIAAELVSRYRWTQEAAALRLGVAPALLAGLVAA